MDGQTDGWTDENTDGWMDRQTEGHLDIAPCVLQDIDPLGLLPKKGTN